MKFTTAAAIIATASITASPTCAFTAISTVNQRASLDITAYTRRRNNELTQQWMSTISDPSTTGKSVGTSAGFNTNDVVSTAAWNDLVNGSAEAASKSAARTYMNTFKGETAAHIIYSKLLEHGTETVNGYSGGAILPLLDQFHHAHPRHGDRPCTARATCTGGCR